MSRLPYGYEYFERPKGKAHIVQVVFSEGADGWWERYGTTFCKLEKRKSWPALGRELPMASLECSMCRERFTETVGQELAHLEAWARP